MSLDWNSGALARGLACYRNREFFETHEHWEEAWNHLRDPERLFVQALIQVTVAMHHFHNANRPGAFSLLERAQRKLKQYPEQFSGIDVDKLRQDVHSWQRALSNTAQFPSVPPAIQILDPPSRS